jgi:catechol 2,3-dioxygenase-like lactoylglutathione lyase family enzyme
MGWKLEGRAVAFVHVADGDAAEAFYGGRLGLDLVSRDSFGMFFAIGDALLRVTPLPDFAGGPHPVAGWDVPDIRATAAGLSAAGVPLTVYDGMGQDALGIWTAPDGGAKVAWFQDPWGNVLSLSETHG